MQSQNPSLVCEVCGARVATLRRGRCWICYVRWAETRPAGENASCAICNERRRDNLRLVEFHGNWVPMCHNCGTKAMRLSPMPSSLEAIRERLTRDRRWQERRRAKNDSRILRKERRVGERRLSPEETSGEWLDADDLIIEVVDMEQGAEPQVDPTRIATREQLPERPGAESC